MAKIQTLSVGFYRIPLPVVLSDSMHGEMTAFELNTVRVRDADGAEGVGYTYTVGRNGAAVHAVLSREIPPGSGAGSSAMSKSGSSQSSSRVREVGRRWPGRSWPKRRA